MTKDEVGDARVDMLLEAITKSFNDDLLNLTKAEAGRLLWGLNQIKEGLGSKLERIRELLVLKQGEGKRKERMQRAKELFESCDLGDLRTLQCQIEGFILNRATSSGPKQQLVADVAEAREQQCKRCYGDVCTCGPGM
jgi:hypothetical protein